MNVKVSWATYFTIFICEDEKIITTTVNPATETAFAYSETYSDCFLNYGFNRWGWTNGPLTEGSYSFDIYAGAIFAKEHGLAY